MRKYAYALGLYVRGLILGILLFIALCALVVTASGVRVFRYQGF
jgi:hypothetical protein